MWTCRRGGMSATLQLSWCGVAAVLATIQKVDAVAQQHYTVKGSIDVFTYEVRVRRSLLTIHGVVIHGFLLNGRPSSDGGFQNLRGCTCMLRFDLHSHVSCSITCTERPRLFEPLATHSLASASLALTSHDVVGRG